MKLIIKSILLAVLLFTSFGCATSGDKFEARLTPPDTFSQTFLLYKEMPMQKAIVVAVDPNGRWAFGFDHSQDDIKQAVQNATDKCNVARAKFKVFTKPKVFAINDEVIYYDQMD